MLSNQAVPYLEQIKSHAAGRYPLKNYHSHSTFCDGKASLEDFVIAAIAAGFTHWGASPHCPLPMLDHAPWAIKPDNVLRYIDEMERLKSKYEVSIKIATGMEIDYIDANFNPSSDYFQNLPLDFRIGSVHLLKSERTGEPIDVDCAPELFARLVERHFGGSVERVVRRYYDALTAMVLAGGFDFVGHTDKISSNATALSGHICERDWYQILVDDFLVLCANKGVALEINTKAYDARGLFFPDERYFTRMAQLGINVIINSDAHRIERITSGLAEATNIWHSLEIGADC